MAVETWIHIAVAVWWSFGVVVFAMLAPDSDDEKLTVCVAALWPVFAVLAFPACVWRSMFRSAKAIRADLRNRRLLVEFEAWRKEREGQE